MEFKVILALDSDNAGSETSTPESPGSDVGPAPDFYFGLLLQLKRTISTNDHDGMNFINIKIEYRAKVEMIFGLRIRHWALGIRHEQ